MQHIFLFLGTYLMFVPYATANNLLAKGPEAELKSVIKPGVLDKLSLADLRLSDVFWTVTTLSE
jgi:hypothetical protein